MLTIRTGNGSWRRTGLALEQGRYRLVPEPDEDAQLAVVPMDQNIEVPENRVTWRNGEPWFEFVHLDKVLERFGSPLCPPPGAPYPTAFVPTPARRRPGSEPRHSPGAAACRNRERSENPWP